MKNLKVVVLTLVAMFCLGQFAYAQSWRDKYQQPSAPTHAGTKRVLPDLIVSDISIPAIRFGTYSGSKIKVPVDVTIKNIGSGHISSRQSFDIHLGAGNNSTFFRYRKGLASKRSVKIRIYLTISDYYKNKNEKFTVHVDRNETSDDVYAYDSVRESNENNNGKSLVLRIPNYRKK